MKKTSRVIVKGTKGKVYAIICKDEEAVKIAGRGALELVEYLRGKGCKVVSKDLGKDELTIELECPWYCFDITYIVCDGERCITRHYDLKRVASKRPTQS